MKKFKVLEIAKEAAKETIELTRKLNYDSVDLKKATHPISYKRSA